MSEKESERNEIESLLMELNRQPPRPFPATGSKIEAPATHGVYLIRSALKEVLHVGRTVSGKNGLAQRLRNHLSGKSSFVRSYLNGDAKKLRDGYTFQFIEIEDDRKRALLEHRAIAWHCPRHLGLGNRGLQAVRHLD